MGSKQTNIDPVSVSQHTSGWESGLWPNHIPSVNMKHAEQLIINRCKGHAPIGQILSTDCQADDLYVTVPTSVELFYYLLLLYLCNNAAIYGSRTAKTDWSTFTAFKLNDAFSAKKVNLLSGITLYGKK